VKEGRDPVLTTLLYSIPFLDDETNELDYIDHLNDIKVDDLLDDLLIDCPPEPRCNKSNDSAEAIAEKENELNNYLQFINKTWPVLRDKLEADPNHDYNLQYRAAPWTISKDKQLAA
jgi:hypothetical protein